MKAYLVEAKRTAFGRAHAEKGIFAAVRADDLLAALIADFVPRILPAAAVSDVYAGCVGQHLEQGKNIARLALLQAGLPPTVPGTTINRLCASSLQALNFGAMAIQSAHAEVILAGGVEHMTHVPMTAALDYNRELLGRYEFPFPNMGLTAEKVAALHGISRQEQDAFALSSHQKAAAAQKDGHFAREIHPILAGRLKLDHDQCPRAETDMPSLGQLKTVFKEDGTVTAGNSSPLSDGASLTLLASERAAQEFGLTPQAEVVDFVVVGVDPLLMGMGPVPAIQKLLAKVGMKIEDIGLFELNEAFASQAIACARALNIPPQKLNPWGGAIALGHPLGATGTRLVTTLLNGLRYCGVEWGIAAMCVGHGQGVATLIRRVN